MSLHRKVPVLVPVPVTVLAVSYSVNLITYFVYLPCSIFLVLEFKFISGHQSLVERCGTVRSYLGTYLPMI